MNASLSLFLCAVWYKASHGHRIQGLLVGGLNESTLQEITTGSFFKTRDLVKSRNQGEGIHFFELPLSPQKTSITGGFEWREGQRAEAR